MPTYNYRCKTCSHIEVIMHSMKGVLKPICSKCGGTMVKRIGSGGYIKFVGGGFHCNDYKKEGKENDC